MSLEDLRAKEERVRSQLVVVRATLANAATKIDDATHARAELAVIGSGKSEGVYRDAAVERASELHARIDAASAATTERERMRHEETALLEELESARRGIERAGIRRNVLPILDHVPQATPCIARWDEMVGDGDVRVCAQCNATVLNLVMLEPAQAETLLGARKNLHRRADGTILAGDCPAAQQRKRASWQIVVGMSGLLIIGAAVFIYAQVARPAPQVGALTIAANVDDFGGEPPHSPRYEIDPHLDRATSVHVRQHYAAMNGPHELDATLTRHDSSTFTYKLSCRNGKGKASAEGSVDAVQVDTFLRSVNAQESDVPAARTSCRHTDDYPTYNVDVETPLKVTRLSVTNCSRQWLVDGKPIAPETTANETPHPAINYAYQALLGALDVQTCEASTRPPSHAPLKK